MHLSSQQSSKRSCLQERKSRTEEEKRNFERRTHSRKKGTNECSRRVVVFTTEASFITKAPFLAGAIIEGRIDGLTKKSSQRLREC